MAVIQKQLGYVLANMNQYELLEKAIGLAVKAHQGQRDRYGAPYILHPLRVMARIEDVQGKVLAILHDVVEDTQWTLPALRAEGFPEPILHSLDCLTKREGEEYDEFVKRSASDPLALRVKLADLEDNMDVRRLPEITEQDRARLQKYLGAWKRLTGLRNSS